VLAELASDPSFSPDGSRIVFASAQDRNGRVLDGPDDSHTANELYVMDADGTDPREPGT
jgi:Tol biopolymer transport system component